MEEKGKVSGGKGFTRRRGRGSDYRLIRTWIQLRMLERSTKYAGRNRRSRSAYWYELRCRFADAASPDRQNICDLGLPPRRSCGTCTPDHSVATGPRKRLPAEYRDDRSVQPVVVRLPPSD